MPDTFFNTFRPLLAPTAQAVNLGPRGGVASNGAAMPRNRSGTPAQTRVAPVLAFIAAPAQCLALKLDYADNALTHEIHFMHPAGSSQIEAALRDASPRAILIDAALIQRLGLSAALELRLRFPAPAWILAGQTPSECWTDLIVLCRARGSIEWRQAPRTIGRAIDTVLDGDLWFPRSTLKALYFALLAMHHDADPIPGHHDAPLEGHGHAALTHREAESLALMRKGLTNKQIAQHLGISVNTVKKHLAHAFEKAGLHSRRQTLV